jgi:hypothetical protein
MNVTRRQLLVAFAVLAAGAVLRLPAQAVPKRRSRRKIYRLSSRGRRASPAVKAHNANFRFRTKRAAKKNPAHKGDTSQVVPLTVSVTEFRRLFPGRRRVADLRTL